MHGGGCGRHERLPGAPGVGLQGWCAGEGGTQFIAETDAAECGPVCFALRGGLENWRWEIRGKGEMDW